MGLDAIGDIAAAAGRRWAARTDKREAKQRQTQIEAEPPERVQARLDRLQEAARSDNLLLVPSDATPPSASVLHDLGLERTFGQSDFQNIAFLELALAVSRFVGRINIRSSASRTVGFGTGSMVSPRLLLTNNHVLKDPEAARFSQVEFDYQIDRDGRALQTYPFALRPDIFFLTDATLDYTLVAVAERSSLDRDLKHYGWSRLIEAQGKILLKEHVNIIQHPRGQYKQFVTRNNEVVDILDNYLHYVTDTEPGSSGSPVYNDQWEVVALHHAGVPRMIGGRLANKRGGPWDGANPDDIDWVANEGIRVSKLIASIKAVKLDGQAARLRDELLNLDAPHPMEAARQADADAKNNTSVQVPPAFSPPGGTTPGTVRPGGAVTFTVPLRITVELGEAPERLMVGKAASWDAGLPAVDDAAKGGTAASAAGGAGQPPAELADALSELSRASSRPYYDAAADGRARVAYYKGIAPQQLDPGAFYRALSALAKRTHATVLPYAPATHVYPWVDLRQADPPTIRSIYSGKGFDPRELIKSDFRIAEQRERAAEAMAAATDLSRESAQAGLETILPYNCEHVVPQSWFDKREPMRGDLHHLFACESGCNSFRGNFPYYDFPEFEEALRSDCGKRESSGFEPSAGKGAVARATLYFLLRYPGLVGDKPGELGAERVATLLAWHHKFPVDDYERHRNAAIADKQGNRNPLIDFPEWADRIAFSQGFAAQSSVAAPDDGGGEAVRDLPSAVAAIAALDLHESLAAEVAAEAAQFGHYLGLPPKVALLDDGRKLKLLDELVYIEQAGGDWPVPKDWVVDGASIPRAFWSLIGGPLEGRYRIASIIHDYYCDNHAHSWRDTHRMFYEAMRCSGMGEAKAKVMYYAVYRFGPRWDLGGEAFAAEHLQGTVRTPTDRDAPTLLADAEAIYTHGLDLDEIDNLGDARDRPVAVDSGEREEAAVDPALLERAHRLVITGGRGDANDLDAVAREAAGLPSFVLSRFERKKIRFVACRDAVTDFERALHNVTPRGWEGTGRTWDDVPGTYLDAKKRVVIATVGEGQARSVPTRDSGRHGSASLTVHESLHGYDYSGRHAVIAQTGFVGARDADLDRLGVYERQPGQPGAEETFAESGARFVAEPDALQRDWPNLFAFWQDFAAGTTESFPAVEEEVAINDAPEPDPEAPIGTIMRTAVGAYRLELRAEGPGGAIGHAMFAINKGDKAYAVLGGQFGADAEATEADRPGRSAVSSAAQRACRSALKRDPHVHSVNILKNRGYIELGRVPISAGRDPGHGAICL